MTQTTEAPILRVRGAVKSFGGARVLDGVDLELGRGETVALLGPSGCGKTVLLKCIVGLITLDEGEIVFDGASVTAMSEAERLAMRRRVGLMFQYNALFDSMTVAENVAYGLHEGGGTPMPEADIEARVAWALECVGLAGTQALRPEELSGGMRKRVGLARTMALRPEVILYDEPTMGLDPVNAHRIGALIQGLHTRFGISSLMDVWCLLRNLELAGERTRGLYVCKARGMAHSNQIREFLLTEAEKLMLESKKNI